MVIWVVMTNPINANDLLLPPVSWSWTMEGVMATAILDDSSVIDFDYFVD